MSRVYAPERFKEENKKSRLLLKGARNKVKSLKRAFTICQNEYKPFQNERQTLKTAEKISNDCTNKYYEFIKNIPDFKNSEIYGSIEMLEWMLSKYVYEFELKLEDDESED